MLNEAVNRLRGQARIRVESPFPERILNLCSARGLGFWDLQWESPDAFTCRMRWRDWERLRGAAAELTGKVQLIGREGASYALRRLRRRQALVLGLTLGAAALFLGSFFIWDFTVTGNDTVPRETILRALERCGVGVGTFGLSLDGEDIRNHVLLEVPELQWIAVNVSGCRARVQVVERVAPPEILDDRTPANIVARRAGLVLRTEATGGTAAVRAGDTVTEGQLLISGVEDLETLGARVTAGRGRVEGRTWYALTASVPLTAAKKRYTGRERTLLSLVFGTHRVKFFSNSSIAGREYDKITHRSRWSVLGVPLPVTAVREHVRFYETVPAAQTPDQVRRRTEAALQSQLRAMVSPYGAVRSALCTVRQRQDTLEVTLTAECTEELGAPTPVYLESTKAAPG